MDLVWIKLLLTPLGITAIALAARPWRSPSTDFPCVESMEISRWIKTGNPYGLSPSGRPGLPGHGSNTLIADMLNRGRPALSGESPLR